MDRGAWRAPVLGVCKESGTTERLTHMCCLRQSVLSAWTPAAWGATLPRGELAFWAGFWKPQAQPGSLPGPPSPQEHFNYYSLDAALGHLVFSLKYDVIGDQEHLRLLLR